jgi:hypothetical protein
MLEIAGARYVRKLCKVRVKSLQGVWSKLYKVCDLFDQAGIFREPDPEDP